MFVLSRIHGMPPAVWSPLPFVVMLLCLFPPPFTLLCVALPPFIQFVSVHALSHEHAVSAAVSACLLNVLSFLSRLPAFVPACLQKNKLLEKEQKRKAAFPSRKFALKA